MALAAAALAVPAPAYAADSAKRTVIQLGLFQKEGEAWWAWQSLARRTPDLANGLTPLVAPLDPGKPGGGVVLRATVTSGADAATLCRRMVGAGHGCLVVEQAAAVPAAASAPKADSRQPVPAGAPATAPAVIQPAAVAEIAARPVAAPVTVPVPAPSLSVATALAVAVPPLPNPAPAAAPAPATAPPAPGTPAEGLITYTDEDAKVLADIERRNRRHGRLGAVLPDVKLEITPAVLTRPGWNLCALTFDDGPHRTVTRQILDILTAEKVRSTYFPIGKVAAQFPDIIRDFLAAGHEIGNHSLTHTDMRPMAAAGQRHEIAEANRILRDLGATPVLFRPPYGRYNLELLAIARNEKMSPVLWNVDTRDWKVRDPDKIVQHVKTAAGTGSVLLLHSTYASTANALPRVIADLRSKGCQFVSLSDWIARMQQATEPQVVNASDVRRTN